MTTMFASAVGAMVAILSAGTPVAPQVARVRLRPFASGVDTAVVVRPLAAEVSEASLYPNLPVSWTTSITVECYARSSAATTTPDVAVDSLVANVFARLMADTTLGGAVLALQPQSITWDFDADGDNTTCATLVFRTRHRSPGATLL